MKKILFGLLIALFALSTVTIAARNCTAIIEKQNLIQEQINTLENLSWERELTAKELKQLDNLRIKADRLYDRYIVCEA